MSNVPLVKLSEDTTGHGPIRQPTYLSQVQLPSRGVVRTCSRSHGVWSPDLGIDSSLGEGLLHPPGESPGCHRLMRFDVRYEKGDVVSADTGHLQGHE